MSYVYRLDAGETRVVDNGVLIDAVVNAGTGAVLVDGELRRPGSAWSPEIDGTDAVVVTAIDATTIEVR